MTGCVRYRRGAHVESVHRVHAAVVNSSGRTVATVGDPGRWTFYRSAAKPFQALPLLEDGAADRLGIPPQEIAVCCASHSGEDEHLSRVRELLARIGLTVEALECGARPPLYRDVWERMRREGMEPTPLHDNCSGKHAGMLALAVDAGWPTAGYVAADHPVQRRATEEVARWSGIAAGELRTAVDGCGVVCFAVPLERMAASYARLAGADAVGDDAAARVVAAMTEHPFLVAGTGRLDTEVMRASRGRVLAKSGSEGVRCAGIPGEGLGIALKVEDGAGRAADPALLRVLALAGALDEAESEVLAALRRPAVRDARGREVGRIETDFDLTTA